MEPIGEFFTGFEAGGNDDGAGQFQESGQLDAKAHGGGVGLVHCGKDQADLAGGSEEVGEAVLATLDNNRLVTRTASVWIALAPSIEFYGPDFSASRSMAKRASVA